MSNILILHSTIDGQTKKICNSIANHINQLNTGSLVLQKSVVGCTIKDIENSDIIILGASVRYGKHRNTVYQFVEQYKDHLQSKTSAFFSVNLVARKPEKNTASTNSYLIKFLEQTAWKPDLTDVFAGKLDYSLYGFLDKLMIKFIMWMTKGPTHSDEPIEFTDWQRVKEFTHKIVDSIEPLNINEADDNHFASQITALESPMENIHIVCHHCNATNRIPADKIKNKPNCGKCQQPLFNEHPINLSNNIHKLVQTNQVLTIIDFWASWCQPCIQMAPQFNNASAQLPHVIFAKLQTDKFTENSAPYNIRSLPTMVAFKNGVELARMSGLMSTAQIVQWVSNLDS